MAKRSKSDLVGNLINKRKMMSQAPDESVAQAKKAASIVEETPDLSETQEADKTKAEVVKDKKSEVASEKSSPSKKPAQKKKQGNTKKKTLGEVGSILSELKEDKKQDKYASIKIKSELYNRIKKIARKEGIDRHGHLIDRVLTDFCDRYEEK